MRTSVGLTFLLDPQIASAPMPETIECSRELVTEPLPDAVSEPRPDVVVLMSTLFDVANRQWSVDEGPLEPSATATSCSTR